MITRSAPPRRCPAAASRAVNTPVDSMTTSMPWSPQGISAGSRSSSFLISLPSTENPPSLTLTSLRSVPPTESCFSRKAIVSLSPNGSLTATSSTPALSPRSSRARWKERPIRPYPLIPTRTVIRCASVLSTRSPCSHAAGGLQQSPQRSRQSARIVHQPVGPGHFGGDGLDTPVPDDGVIGGEGTVTLIQESVDPGAVLLEGQQMVGGVEPGRLRLLGSQGRDLQHPPRRPRHRRAE